MRRTRWAVFTSMNPRPSAWRPLYDAAPAETAQTDAEPQRQLADDPPPPTDLPDQRLRV